MPLVDIVEDFAADSCSDSGDVRSIKREILVYFTVGTGEGSIDARLVVGLRKGQQHHRDPLSYVDNVSASLYKSIIAYSPPELPSGVIDCTAWRVVVTYSTLDRAKFENPCDQQPKRDWDTIEVEKPLEKAWDVLEDPNTQTLPIVNVLGEPLMGLTEPDYIWVFSWSKNLPKEVWNPLVYDGWLNKINKTEWQGIEGGYAKYVSIKWNEAEPVIVDNRKFEYGTLSLQIHFYDWTKHFLNCGFRAKVDTQEGTSIKPIEIEGVPVSTPQLLDEDGYWIKPEDLKPTGTKDPYYLDYFVSEMKDFADFPVEVTLV